MSKFWENLKRATTKQDIIEIESSWLGKPEDAKKLFTRECYKDIWRIISELNSDMSVFGLSINGNPGIGKTWLLGYILYNLRLRENVTVVFDISKSSTIVYKLDNEGVEEGTLSDFRDELGKRTTWYLVDGKAPEQYSAFTILTSSPHPGTIFRNDLTFCRVR